MSQYDVNKAGSEYLYLTEILNDLNKNGYCEGGIADTMLKDWRDEFRGKMNFPKTKQRKVHAKHTGTPVFW